jgi:DNA-binding MarR family transcriptional regulator
MRAFNRFYTERIGALDERHEGLDLTIAESRCLFTIRRLESADVGQVATELGLDLGYVSRLLSRLEGAGRVTRSRAEDDGRRRVVTLTDEGARLLEEVERRSNARMDALTAHLRGTEVTRLLEAMDTIRALLDRTGPQEEDR